MILLLVVGWVVIVVIICFSEIFLFSDIGLFIVLNIGILEGFIDEILIISVVVDIFFCEFCNSVYRIFIL